MVEDNKFAAFVTKALEGSEEKVFPDQEATPEAKEVDPVVGVLTEKEPEQQEEVNVEL